MRWFYTLPLRVRSLLRRRQVERELDEELRYHVERRIEHEIARGLAPEEARYAALRAMEGIEQQKERCRDTRRVNFIANLLQDLRYAARMMRKKPGFTAVAMSCLALGIGANTAIFTLMNALMLKSLPVKDPGQLVALRYTTKKGTRLRRSSSGYGSTSLSYAAFEHLKKHSRLAASLFGFVPLGLSHENLTVSAGGQPSLAAGEMVTGEYFSGLGVSPILGRALAEPDRRPDAPRVAVIGYGYWARRFGRERSVIGRTVALNAVPFTIVGVMPPEFYGVDPEYSPDVWLPLRDDPAFPPWGVNADSKAPPSANDRWWWLMIMARRKPGVGDEQLRAELDVLFRQSVTAGWNPPPKAEELPRLELMPAAQGLNFLRNRFSKPLRVLTIAVGLILLIACANVATLLLARAAARRKEMSVRLATGASRWRLIRQLLTESLLLASGAGALGLAFAWWGSRALVFLISERGQPIALAVDPDRSVLAFCAAVSFVTGILFGLAPAFRATRVELALALKENSTALSPRLTLGNVLVAGQVALSLLLLIGAGLYIRTLQNLQSQDLGFDRRNLLLFALDARRGGATPERIRATYDQVLERLQGLPGVRSATASQMGLLTGWVNTSNIVTDGPKPPPGASDLVYWNRVGPAFFETMGIRLVLGRGIEWRDIRSARRVAVVNEALARLFFPEGPLGRHFNFGTTLHPEDQYEIVGVVRNARYDSLHNEAPRTAYLPYGEPGSLFFEVRTAGDPVALVPAVRRIVQEIDSNLPLKNVGTQSERIDESLKQEAMFARLSAFFGGLALLLVAVGLYGTLAYGVTRRTNEIGIRMALGAERRQVIWMVLRQSLILIGAGIGVGLPVALALTRYISSQLYGVKPNDVPTIAVTVMVLAAVGAAAACLPARRAARVAPTLALRYE